MALRRAGIDFITSPSGLLVPEVTDSADLDAAEVTFDIVAGTTEGWVLTTVDGEAAWAPPEGGGEGIPQGGPLTEDLDADGFKVINAADPDDPQDYVTKAYGDANYAGTGDTWTVVTKTGDESVSSSVALQADNELVFTTVSGTMYIVEVYAIYASPAGGATPDIIFGFGEDTTARGAFAPHAAISAAEAAGVGGTLARGSGQQTGTIGTQATNRLAYSFGWYLGAGGTFSVYWAQGTSSGNATIVRAGSFLRYRSIGTGF